MAAAFGVALALSGVALLFLGAGTRGIFVALRVTARWSFLIFWLAYVAGPSRALFGDRLQWLAAHGRTFGLSFASAHLVHVGLVIWLYEISPEPPVPQSSLIFFGVGVFWTYLLAVLSIPVVFRLLGTQVSRFLMQLGLHYIAFAFLSDFTSHSQAGILNGLAYLPFIAMGVAGFGLRAVLVMRQVSRRGYARVPVPEQQRRLGG